jgi:hypothetical protein
MSDPTSQPSSSSKGLPPAIANLGDSTLLWIQVGGGLLAFIGVFLPWVTVSSSFITRSANGFDDGIWGILVFILSIALAALAFIKVRNIQVQGLDKIPARAPLIGAGVLAAIAVFRWIYILADGGTDVDNDFLEALGVDVSTGVGIWFVLIGSLAVLFGALVPALKNRNS